MIGCAILGATGAVGQRFVKLLDGHSMFRIDAVSGSPANSGRQYADATAWFMDTTMPNRIGRMSLQTLDTLDPQTTPLVFSALPGGIAGPAEIELAKRGFRVFTNAGDNRMNPDVPLLIPEINAAAAASVVDQPGFIVANGNCSGIILTLALAPLHAIFGLTEVDVVTMQARSGAGNPAAVDLDTVDNVLPFIGGEEEKLETEPAKTLGSNFPIRATCTRVDVSDGHICTVHARLSRPATAEEVTAAFASFVGPAEVAALPSAPRHPIHVAPENDRPQPKLDRDRDAGMAVTVGRIRVDGDRVQFVVLGHNTVRGAAGQSILNAEYIATKYPSSLPPTSPPA